MCWNRNATGRSLLWHFQTEEKPKMSEVPWECLFQAYFCRQICPSSISFVTVTQDGQEIAEFKHVLTVTGLYSYKVLNRTAWRKIIGFPEGFPYFEAWLQFDFFFFFLWKQMTSTLSVKREGCSLVLWECMVDPANGACWQKILKNFIGIWSDVSQNFIEIK